MTIVNAEQACGTISYDLVGCERDKRTEEEINWRKYERVIFSQLTDNCTIMMKHR